MKCIHQTVLDDSKAKCDSFWISNSTVPLTFCEKCKYANRPNPTGEYVKRIRVNRNVERAFGPGSFLHSMIRSVTGQEPTSSCGCSEMIAKMNQAGWKLILSPLKGREVRVEIYEHLKKEAEKRGVEVKASLWSLLLGAHKEYWKQLKAKKEGG